MRGFANAKEGIDYGMGDNSFNRVSTNDDLKKLKDRRHSNVA